MQLQPKETFVIARGIADPLDSTTYYVRATVRNAKTDDLLATVNLIDRGEGRFSAPYEVPSDSSGLGLYITILTRVYTDAAYTVLADAYGQETATFLVQERMNPNLGGMGGGADIDYKKIRKIFEEAVSGLIKNIPEQKDVDLSGVLASLKAIGKSITDIKIPEQKEANIAPMLQAIEGIKKMISDIKIPEAVNLEPVVDAMQAEHRGLESEVKEMFDEVKELLIEITGAMDQYITESTSRFESVAKIHGILNSLAPFVPERQPAAAEESPAATEPSEDDIKKAKRPFLYEKPQK